MDAHWHQDLITRPFACGMRTRVNKEGSLRAIHHTSRVSHFLLTVVFLPRKLEMIQSDFGELIAGKWLQFSKNFPVFIFLLSHSTQIRQIPWLLLERGVEP